MRGKPMSMSAICAEPGRRSSAGDAVVRDAYPVPRELEQPAQRFGGVGVVFHDQDVAPGSGRRGHRVRARLRRRG